MLLNSVGLDVREAHGFSASPLVFLMARDRLSGPTRIVVETNWGADCGTRISAPGKFVVELKQAATEMAALHDKWMREGDDWLPVQPEPKD